MRYVFALLLVGCANQPTLECTKREDKAEEWDRFVELCYANSKWMSDLRWCKLKAANMGYGTCLQDRP